MKKVIALILVGALCGGATIFLPRILHDYKKSIPAKKSVYIPLQATYSQMLDSIATAVDDMKSFKNVARRNELEKNFKPGRYVLTPDKSNKDLARMLRMGWEAPKNFRNHVW